MVQDTYELTEKELISHMSEIRKSLHMTQQELAQKSGSTQQEISRLEKQKHSPSVRTLCKILDSIDYKLTFTKKERKRKENER